MSSLLEKTLANIGPLDQTAIKQAKERLDNLTKPLESLGVLEDLAMQLAGITGNPMPQVGDKVVLVMAGDHGVAAEKVTCFPQEVTQQQITNFIRGGGGISVMTRHVGARVECVDVGIAAHLDYPGLIQKKVALGTKNMAKGPAMTREEAIRSLEVGIEVAEDQIRRGATLIGTGEMGIANTTPSSAILAAFSGLPVRCIVGRGAGINDTMLRHKTAIIEQSLAVNQPDTRDPIDVLSKIGGLEIGAIAGVMLAAAAHRIPVIIDGFISGAGALIASRIEPQSRNYMIASHNSVEPGHNILLKLLDLEPMLQMKMRLGEGTGAALAMNLVEASCKMIHEMATFAEAGVTKQEI
ncbi:MAG TPA: nicotinate-nucleotide--dimethylbenzimidazole phosphoribosyltransferase [Patescibacteria group bacterium]|nr:nicotinate-nucleotide--dimethylbenzimidazole phosphoribosyltransferase [Patescibacteria group bacterium]